MSAFTEPRKIQPGCQHQLACKCDIPYHLRPSTPIERERERKYNAPLYGSARIAIEGDL